MSEQLTCHRCRRVGIRYELYTRQCDRGDGCVLGSRPSASADVFSWLRERVEWGDDRTIHWLWPLALDVIEACAERRANYGPCDCSMCVTTAAFLAVSEKEMTE